MTTPCSRNPENPERRSRFSIRRIIRPALLLRLGASLVSGLLIALSFPQFNLHLLAWIAFTPLLFAIEGIKGMKAFLFALLAGATANCVGFYWMVHLLTRFGHLPYLPSLLLVGAGSFYQGLSIAIAFPLASWVAGRTPLPRVVVLPLFYTVLETFHPILFPWFLGNSQYPFLHLIQVCDIAGVQAVTFLIMAGNVAVFEAAAWLVRLARLRFRTGAVPLSARKGKMPEGPVGRPLLRSLLLSLAFFGLLLAAYLGYGHFRLERIREIESRAKKLKVAVVEPEIPIFEEQLEQFPKDDPPIWVFRWNNLSLQWASIDLEKKKPDLIVWPESSYFPAVATWARCSGSDNFQQYLYWLPPDAEQLYFASGQLPKVRSYPEAVIMDLMSPEREVNAVQRGFATPLLFGATSGILADVRNPNGLDSTRYNSAFLLDGNSKVLGRYDKQYLLAFGEYIPLGDVFPFLYDWSPESGRFKAGPNAAPLDFRGHRLGVLICYEDIIQSYTNKVAAQGVDVLINLTNDAWFGKTYEPYQHFVLALFRAVEQRRALVRSTSTGISGMVSATGEIMHMTDLYDPETFIAQVPLLDLSTAYRSWGHLIPFAALLLCVGLIGWAWIMMRRQKSPSRA